MRKIYIHVKTIATLDEKSNNISVFTQLSLFIALFNLHEVNCNASLTRLWSMEFQVTMDKHSVSMFSWS